MALTRHHFEPLFLRNTQIEMTIMYNVKDRQNYEVNIVFDKLIL